MKAIYLDGKDHTKPIIKRIVPKLILRTFGKSKIINSYASTDSIFHTITQK